MDQRLRRSERAKTMKLSEENRDKSYDLGFGNKFLDVRQKHEQQEKKHTLYFIKGNLLCFNGAHFKKVKSQPIE